MANTRTVDITISAFVTSTDLIDWPVLLTRSCFPDEIVDPSSGNASKTDGGDLRFFVDGDAVPCDIVYWEHDSATGAGDANIEVHVLCDVTAAAGVTITVEYGDGTLAQPARNDALGSESVWPNLFSCWHLGGGEGNLRDATGRNDLSEFGTGAGFSTAYGMLDEGAGGGWRATGTNPGGPTLYRTGAGAGDLPEGNFTVSALANPDLFSTVNCMVSFGRAGDSTQVARLLFNTSVPADTTMGWRTLSTNYNASGSETVGAGNARAVHGLVDTTANRIEVYENGVSLNTDSTAIVNANLEMDQVVIGGHGIGSIDVSTESNFQFDGNLDEVRLWDRVFSDAEVAADEEILVNITSYATPGAPADISTSPTPGPVTPNLDGSTGLSVGMSRPMSRPLSGAL